VSHVISPYRYADDDSVMVLSVHFLLLLFANFTKIYGLNVDQKYQYCFDEVK